MSPTSSESTILAVIRRGIVNFIYFISSIAGVVGIIIHGEEVSKLEFTGTLIVVSACYIILYFFLLQFRNEILKIPRKTLFILITILLFLLITKAVASLPGRNIIFLIPFAVIPVMIRIFYDARLALFILLITIMMAAFLVQQPFEFVLSNLLRALHGHMADERRKF